MSNNLPLSTHKRSHIVKYCLVIVYFFLLIILSYLQLSFPELIVLGLLFGLLPGYILIASSTLLAYSAALLPAFAFHRRLNRRLPTGIAAVVGLAAVALLPHYLDEFRLSALRAGDFSNAVPTGFRPRSVELPRQQWDIYWTRPQGRDMPTPVCSDLCQQLLFKSNLNEVVIFGDSSQDPFFKDSLVMSRDKAYLVPAGHKAFRFIDLANDSSVTEVPIDRVQNPSKYFAPKWRRFRLEQREPCPQTVSIVEFSEDRRCLIEDIVESAEADVVLSISGAENRRNDTTIPGNCGAFQYRGIQEGPTTVKIAERRNGIAIPVEAKTTLTARYPTVPFYFDTRFISFDACPGVATEAFSTSFADPFEMLSRRYGLPIARTSHSDGRPPQQ